MNFLKICRIANRIGKHASESTRFHYSRSLLDSSKSTIFRGPFARRFSILATSQMGHIDKHQRSEGLTVAKRFRKRTRGKSLDSKDDGQEEEDDDDDEELAGENPLLVDDILGSTSDGSESVTLDVASLRLDVIAKSVFSMSRSRVEEVFYKGDFYINGVRPHKKSVEICENDEIDWVKQINPEDNRLVDIKRATLVKLPDKTDEQGRMKIKMRRWNDLTVEAPNRKSLEDN